MPLEGASDPDDMLTIVALTCPHCSTRCTHTHRGPNATIEDSATLLHPQRVMADAGTATHLTATRCS